MPSFGLPSFMPAVSSSPSLPCLSTVLSSNISSCSESSCAPAPDGCLSHLLESTYLCPPPPLSLSEAGPYSPPPAYPPVFPFGPPLASSARFPPPPNSSFVQPVPNITFFEGPHSHYPPEPHTAYDRWTDRNVISTADGGDNISKCFSRWPLPTFNSSINSNKSNSNIGFFKPEPLFPSPAPYPPLDSVANFGPTFSPLPWDSSPFANAAVMPSNSSAPITSPLASGHFPAFPPPSVPMDFPHSAARFVFNPHASTFTPGMDSTPSFGPDNADFIPESVTNYLQCTGAFPPRNSFEAPDHFHNTSSHPIQSPEIASCPIVSNSPAYFLGHQQPIHGSFTLNTQPSHPLVSRTNDAPGPLCSSSTSAPVLEPSWDFPSPSSLPYPPPVFGTPFCPHSSAPTGHQDSARSAGVPLSSGRDEEGAERIVSDTAKLMYQNMSPEEWRWKHYEPLYADALDPSASFARVRSSEYNLFHGVDCSPPNSSNGLLVKEEGSSLSALKNQKEQADILERCKAQNHPGPSLKLAASALAEMLALGSNGETNLASRSMLAQIASTSGSALTSDASYPPVNAASGGQSRTGQERMLDDCCSSSGSAVVHKDIGDSFLSHKFGEVAAESYSSGFNLCSPTRSKREIPGQLEDAFCVFGGAPAAWALPKASGQSESSSNPRSTSLVGGVPQSAKGGPLHMTGQRRVFSKGSAGILRQSSVSTRSTKLHGMNAEDSTSENLNTSLRQLSNSLESQSGRMRNVSSQPVGVLSSTDATSAVGPFVSKVAVTSGLSLFGPHQEVSSGVIGSHSPLDSSHDDQWHVKSTSCGSSPPLSQAYLDPHGSISGRSSGGASKGFANLKCGCPDSFIQTEVGHLGTGFQALTASISNLSKVLFSLDSSAVTPPDSAVLEETLQSSILRLSECLLLEQSRLNRNPVTRHVGSDESSGSRQGRADGSFRDVDLVYHAETGGSTNLSHLKASEGGILTGSSRTDSPAQLGNVDNLKNAADIAALDTVDTGGSLVHSHSFQKHVPSKSASYGNSKCAMIEGASSTGKVSGCSYPPSGQSPTAKLQGSVSNDVIEFLRDNDIFERTSLERLIDAEAREAKLKALVEDLREELELERVENRGTAFLCEKIMLEAEISRAKPVRHGAGNAEVELKRGNVESNLQCLPSTTEISNSGKSYKTKSLGVNSQSNFSSDKTDCSELKEELGSAALVAGSKEPLLNDIEQVQAHQAFLQAQSGNPGCLNSSHGTSGRLREEMNAGNWCAGAVSNNTDQAKSRLELLQELTAAKAQLNVLSKFSSEILNGMTSEISTSQLERLREFAVTAPVSVTDNKSGSMLEQPAAQQQLLRSAATAPLDIPHDISGSVESRLALLQARPDAVDTWGAYDAAPAHSKCSQDAPADASLEGRLAFVQAVPNSSHNAPREIGPRRTISPLDVLQDVDHVEARLAVLQARPDWDNELGVFTETEPCTPAKPAAVNLELSKGGLSGLPLSLPEEQVTLAAKTLEAMSHITSQLLIQSETISNIQTAWGQLSEQVHSKHREMDFDAQLRPKESDLELPNTSAQAYDDIQAIEARALLIRSRSDWTEADGSESETEDSLGGQICKVSITSSGCGRYESSQSETLSEISLVRLLDSDVQESKLLPVKSTTEYHSLVGAEGNTSTVESPDFDKETPSKPQDIEEDSGWEHIRLPRKEAE